MKYPIRILHVLGGLNRGGAETMVMNLYRNIDRSKIQFDFIIHTEVVCDYDDEIKSLGGRIFRIPRYKVINHFQYKREWQLFLKEHPEYKIIHGHVRSTASIYLKIAKNMGLITIAHSHSISSGYGVKSILKYILQKNIKNIADYFFACSWDAGVWLFGKKTCCKDKFKVIKNAIDCDEFRYKSSVRTQYRKVLKLDNKLVIGHVGRLTYPKNHRFILEIFKEILLQDNSAFLLLVGDGELKSEINSQINNLGLEDNVMMLGSITEVNNILQAMDIFLFPSLYEGFGIAAIEAQAVGLHCFFSEKVPYETKVTDNVNYLSLNLPAKEWACKILSKKNYVRESCAKQISESGYEIKTSANELISLYFEMLKGEPKFEKNWNCNLV